MSATIQGNSELQSINAITQFVDGTQAIWNTITVPIPAGLVVYATDTTAVKLGDGQTLYADLPTLFTLDSITSLTTLVNSIVQGNANLTNITDALASEYATLQQAISNIQPGNSGGSGDVAAGTYALLAGDSTQVFNVANAAPGTQEAVPISQADARYQVAGNYQPEGDYAALAGSSTQVFSAANAAPGTQEVVPISQADLRYQAAGNYQPSGNYQPAGSYASLNGSIAQTFNGAKATALTEFVTLGQINNCIFITEDTELSVNQAFTFYEITGSETYNITYPSASSINNGAVTWIWNNSSEISNLAAQNGQTFAVPAGGGEQDTTIAPQQVIMYRSDGYNWIQLYNSVGNAYQTFNVAGATAPTHAAQYQQTGRAGRVAVFLSSGTWTCPDNVTAVVIRGCAAGGGGGHGYVNGTNYFYGGGGGGGAAVLAQELTVVPGTTYTITIGAGGIGSTANGVNGTAGGATSFGTLFTLGGGGGGMAAGTNTNGAGGTAGGAGGATGSELSNTNTSTYSASSSGGGCYFGFGGAASGMFGGGGAGSFDNFAAENGSNGFLEIDF